MFTIKTDDLTHPAVQALVAYHISGMLQQSPPESSHALDVQKLRNPAVTFWSVWEGEQLAGIGVIFAICQQVMKSLSNRDFL